MVVEYLDFADMPAQRTKWSNLSLHRLKIIIDFKISRPSSYATIRGECLM
jgi:hypothetical protein